MSLTITSDAAVQFAQRNLFQVNRNLGTALAKLSSGYKINQAKDHPAGLVISELLRSQVAGLQQAVRNTQETHHVLSIAEGGLGQISSQLQSMRQLALHALNSGVTSPAQVAADQAELNGGLNTIANIAATTRFSGQSLLNGAQSITFTAQDPGAILDTGKTRLESIPDTPGQQLSIQFSGNPADQAEKAYLETSLGGGATLTSTQRFNLTGNQGTATFVFQAGTSIQEMANAINAKTEQTGVMAYAIRDTGSGATELRLVSAQYGADQRVRVEQLEGNAFTGAGTAVEDWGQNAKVVVGGMAMETQGLRLASASGSFTGTLQFQAGTPTATTIAQTGYDQDTLTQATTARQATLTDIKGGMRLQLGEGEGTQNRNIIGIRSFDLSNLGRVEVEGRSYSLADLMSGGPASLARNPKAALAVIDQAIADVAAERARIGAYQANTLQTNSNALQVAIENVMATESTIRDTNMAEEMTNLVKYQILQKAGLLGIQSANVNRQNVLQLLGG